MNAALSNRLGEVWRRRGTDMFFVVVRSDPSTTPLITTHSCLVLSGWSSYWNGYVGRVHLLNERSRSWESDGDVDELLVGLESQP